MSDDSGYDDSLPLADDYTPPFVATSANHDWQTACHAKGGVPTVDPKTGADACRLPDGDHWRYEPANKSFSDVVSGWLSDANDVLTKSVTTVEDWVTNYENPITAAGAKIGAKVRADSGLEDGLTGLGGKVLGIPHWLFVVLAIFALYAVGAGAGVVPPLKKVFK